MIMSAREHIASELPEGESPPDPAPAVAGIPDARAGAPATRRRASGWEASGIACLLLIGVSAVALLLLLVILPVWDAVQAGDSASETYSELRAMSYEAGWRIDSEIYSVQASLDGDLAALDSGLWSVGLDLGSLAYDVAPESRPSVQALEAAVEARRDELRQFRRSADTRFDQFRDSVEARLEGIEGAADAALDDHWDDSGRRSSRNGWVIIGWWGALVAVVLGLAVVELWACRSDRRAPCPAN